MSKRSRLLAVGAVVTAGGLVAAGITVANAAATPPPLNFIAATTDITGERYVDPETGEGWLSLNLGTHVVAGKNPLEIRVNRPAYAKPVVAQQAVFAGGRKTWKNLPAGMVTDFTGLKGFTTVTVRDATGKVAKTWQQDLCLNAYDTGRTRPDAPSDNPYPVGCGFEGGNPFWLGAVQGVQAGWSAPTDASSRWGDSNANRDLPAGKYAVTVQVAPKYLDWFQIPATSALVKLKLTVTEVETGDDGVEGVQARLRAEAGAPAPAGVLSDEHAAHAAQGDPGRQVSAFSNDLRPPARRPAATAAAAVPKGPRPDLRSLPAWGIQLDAASEGKQYINFGATVWNSGTSPLVVDGFRRTGTELMDAYQYYFDAKGKQVGSAKAGTMAWDKREGHLHWHFTDFAQYRLLKADKKVAVISGKEAFCLANTDAVDYTLPNAKWRPSNTDLSTSCGQNTSVAVRQVLDIGGGDTYGQFLPGQSFDVSALPNGTYYIEVLANPGNKLAELSTKNNSSLRKVVLGGSGTDRTLEVPPHEGISG